MQGVLYNDLSIPQELKPYLRRIVLAETTAAIDILVSPGPTGCNYLGWIFSGQIDVTIDDVLQPFGTNCLHIAGQIQFQDVRVRHSGVIGHLVAEFRPTGFYELIPISAGAINGAAFALNRDEHPWITSLDLSKERDTEARCREFTEFFLGLTPNARKAPSFVTSAVEQIEAAQGLVKVSALAEQLGVSERTLTRRFRDIVGVSPKYFARISQINHVMRAFSCNDTDYLTRLAHQLGYFDQAHFNKAIRQFVRANPKAFLKQDNQVFFEFMGWQAGKQRDSNL